VCELLGAFGFRETAALSVFYMGIPGRIQNSRLPEARHVHLRYLDVVARRTQDRGQFLRLAQRQGPGDSVFAMNAPR